MNYPTFTSSLFTVLREAERSHFWFRVRREWIADRLKKFIPPPASILEIGCGTGNVCGFLGQLGYVATGCELFSEALTMAWPGFFKIQARADDLPFKDNCVDSIGFFDVLEHFDDELPLLLQGRRVLKAKGFIVVTVPAREELWSPFDDLSFHRRRYSRNGLKALLRESGYTSISIEYMFASLYLPMKFIRRKISSLEEAFTETRWSNQCALVFCEGERYLSRVFPLPIGTSLLAIAQKKA